MVESYETWKQRLQGHVQKQSGVSLADLGYPESIYHVLFTAGVSCGVLGDKLVQVGAAFCWPGCFSWMSPAVWRW